MPEDLASEPAAAGGTVVVAGASFPSLEVERSFLEPLGCTIVDKRFAADDEALEACRTAVAVMTDYFVCDAARIGTFERCKVICQYGAGLNQVDIAAATAAGIYVTHTPDYCSEELGDHAMALILASMRRIVRFDRNIRAGRWDYNDGMPMRRLAACTLGLVGFGRAARAVAVRAQGFGMTVVAHDPLVDDAAFAAAGVARTGELAELLAAADAVSVHVPLVQSTRHLIGAEQLALLRDGAFIVNTSRGGVIDQRALHAELATGRLGGAGLDVLEQEPPAPDEPLLSCTDAVLTPHTAFLSLESLALLQNRVGAEVARVLSGGEPIYGVNVEGVGNGGPGNGAAGLGDVALFWRGT
ncbi:MAG: C-terminal binding protein [Acidimicrobiia bacterium]|nr:C-terminal binding protein [Acidimicrobiia bacterium]MCY4630256.1 C-terminal binding protein [bacterium]